MLAQNYTSDGVGKAQSADIISATAQQNNPMFYGYDVNQYNFTANPGPITANLQPYYLVTVSGANFRLQAASPGVGKGKTNFSPLATVKVTTGNYGTTLLLPGQDIGAYQSDGTGNQH